MHRAEKMCLQKRLHLSDTGSFAVQKLLGQNPDLWILFRKPVQFLEPPDHSLCVHLNQQICNPGVGIAAAELHPGHSVSQKAVSCVHFPELPASLQCKDMGFRFNGFVFPQLLFQSTAQLRLHGSVQQTADFHLTTLGCFQQGIQNCLVVVHSLITGISMHILCQHIHNMEHRKDVIVMCGISGMISLEASDNTVQKMLATMSRRGPDSQGIYRKEPALLLHARLAIIDPQRGRQPMELSCAGEHYVMVYNGEIYNTEELRRDLLCAGHVFQTHSDTEVLLHAYAEYGADCVRYINGIFAFAVWEENRRRLFLARDRIGVKPLFYKYHHGGLLFASEMKTILAYPSVKAELDEEGARSLIMLGPGRLPGSGVLKGIREIEPGWCGYYEQGRLSLTQYWKLRDREHAQSFEETSDYVCYLVKDAIRRQMVSDVPIGTFLSGGLDSSIITAVCAEELKSRGETLQTFSLDYQNNDRYFRSNAFQPESDNAYIALMQQSLQTEHHWSILSSEELLYALEEAMIARDLPGMADVDASLLVFSGNIRQKVKVALSGECADEIFGGYPWYRDPKVRSMDGFPWAQNTGHRSSFLQPSLRRGAESFVMDAYRQTCLEADILPSAPPQERRMKEMVNLNFRWFMQTLLDRKDRMSMYQGLEVRVPFCDYRIAEYLYGVPWEMKDWQGREKGLLRHAMEGLLPDRILYRKKSPYPKTFDPRYEELVSGQLQQLLEQPSPLWHIIRSDAARDLLKGEESWPWYGQLMRRPQTIAYLLQLDCWLRHYRIDFAF